MLIEMIVDHRVMVAFIVTVAFVLGVGLLAVVAGADSRVDDIARRRRFPG